MSQIAILLTSMTLGVITWLIISWVWFIPWLQKRPLHNSLAILVIPHSFRYIGLSFLITGVTASPLDMRFAAPAAYGDLLTAVLALIAVAALLAKFRHALILVWLFNIIGFVDFIVAVIQGLRYTEPAEMGATYFIPILGVPLFFVLHLVIFWLLITKKEIQS